VSGQQHALTALHPREKPGTHFTGRWVFKISYIYISYCITLAKFIGVCRNVKEFTDQGYRVYLKYLEKFISELFTKEQRKMSIKSCPQMSGFEFH